jgi:hypothetical protein
MTVTHPELEPQTPCKKGVVVALGWAVLFAMSTPLAKVLAGSVPSLILARLLCTGSGLGRAVSQVPWH